VKLAQPELPELLAQQGQRAIRVQLAQPDRRVPPVKQVLWEPPVGRALLAQLAPWVLPVQQAQLDQLELRAQPVPRVPLVKQDQLDLQVKPVPWASLVKQVQPD
jgi:hypothetical protein